MQKYKKEMDVASFARKICMSRKESVLLSIECTIIVNELVLY